MKEESSICLGNCSQSKICPAFKACALAFLPFRLGAEELSLTLIASCSTCDFPRYYDQRPDKPHTGWGVFWLTVWGIQSIVAESVAVRGPTAAGWGHVCLYLAETGSRERTMAVISWLLFYSLRMQLRTTFQRSVTRQTILPHLIFSENNTLSFLNLMDHYLIIPIIMVTAQRNDLSPFETL